MNSNAARFPIALILLVAAFCGAGAQSKPYYVTKPTALATATDSLEPVVGFLDDRALTWLNASFLDHRMELIEGGYCLHIAGKRGPDGFLIDSVAPGFPVPGNTATWRQTGFLCHEDGHWAPIHFHVMVPTMTPWLLSMGLSGYIGQQCRIGGGDVDPFWSRYPLNGMQCGWGLDSIYFYRVKPQGRH